MAFVRRIILIAVSIGSAAPAFAGIYGTYASRRMWGWEGSDYHTRLSDYRNLVAKKTRKDGGVLTLQDRDMLHRRLEQLCFRRDG